MLTTSELVRDLLVVDDGQQLVMDATELEGFDEGIEVTDSTRQVTAHGFIVADAVLARTGVYNYRASELGLDRSHNYEPGRVVRLYRSPEQVFKKEALDTFEDAPVTVDHPVNKLVQTTNWKELAVGEVRGMVANQASGTISSRAIVKDQRGIDALDSGKRFLSPGYKFDLKLTPGTAPGGEQYDGLQTNIRCNHVALVSNPRGGPACRVLDSTGEPEMKIVMVKGIPVQVADDAGVAVVNQLVSDHTAALDLTKRNLKVGDASFTVEQLPAAQVALDAIIKERDELKGKQVTDAQIEERVQARTKLVTSATKLVPGFATDSKSNVAIQREVITSVIAKDSKAKAIVEATLAGKIAQDADDATVNTAFNVLLATAPAAPAAGQPGHTALDASFAAAVTHQGTATSVATPGQPLKLAGRAKFLANQNGVSK